MRAAILRKLPTHPTSSDLVFPGPGGSHKIRMGRNYRHTTAEMLTRVTAAIDERIRRAEKLAEDLGSASSGGEGDE